MDSSVENDLVLLFSTEKRKAPLLMKLGTSIFFLLFLINTSVFGQVTTAFYDNFNRLSPTPGGTPSISYSSSSTGDGVIYPLSVSPTDSVLKITSGTIAGRGILMGPLSSFTSGVLNATLRNNYGLVTWSFNMRQDRGSASINSLTGFDSSSTLKYGIATILVCNKSNPLDSAAKGYAVVMGETGNDTTYDLISFSGGLIKNSNCTRLIKGMVLSYFKDIVSIKVTYNPAGNNWNMYQVEGINSTADPYPDPSLISSATLGMVVNTSFVDSAMTKFGFLWNYGTLPNQNAYFDNFKVTVNKPEIVITSPSSAILNDFIYAGTGPSALQFFTLSGSNLLGNVVVTPPTNFLICATFNGTFVNTPITIIQSGGSISSAIIYIKLKASLALANYSETITLTSSNAVSKTITCNGFVITVSGTPTINFDPVTPVSIIFPATEFLTNSDFQSFRISGTNLGAGTVVTFNTTNNFFVATYKQDIFGVYLAIGTSATLTADANGIISGQNVYVRYYPNEQYSANPVSAIDSLGYQSGTLTYTYGANGPFTAANLKGKIATYYFRITGSTTSKLTLPGNWSASKDDIINNIVSNAFTNGTTTSPINPFGIPGVKFKIITNGYSANNTNISNTTNVSSPADKTIFKISGAGSKLVIGDQSFPGIGFTFPSGPARFINATIDIDSASSGSNKIYYQDIATPAFTFGTLNATSEFHYQARNSTSTTATFGKLFIDVDTLTINSSPSVQTSLTVSSGAALSTTLSGAFCKINMLSGSSDTINGIINIQNTAGLSCGKCSPNSTGTVFNFADPTPNITFGANSIVRYAKATNQTIQPFPYQNIEVTGAGTKTIDVTGGSSAIASVANKLTVGTGTTLSIPSDNLTLKSDSLKTAMLMPCTGTITGKVTVERFLRTKKAWRLLSSPTKHDAQTIRQAWMEGGSANNNPNPGYGIQITSNRSSWQTDGFDAVSSGPSIKYLDSSTNNWVGQSSTNLNFENGKAYMTFVRGNRTVTAFGQTPTSTIIKEKGTLNIGNITFSSLGPAVGNKFVALGNPYAAAVNIGDVIKNNSTNLDQYYYLWDPMLSGTNGVGGYQTVTIQNSGSLSLNPGSGSYSSGVANLESGQGFIVHTKIGASGSINFSETNKLDSSRLASRVIKPYPTIRNNLYKIQNGETALMDGVLNVYDSSSSNQIDERDALKLYNPSENVAIKTNGKFIAIENRESLLNTDTIFYNLSNLQIANYRFQFTPEYISDLGLEAYLEDTYLNAQTPVSLVDLTPIDFTVTNDPGSFTTDRFRLIFKLSRTVPVTFIDIRAERQQKNILVSWNVANEINIHHYEIERAADGNHFVLLGSTNAVNTPLYNWVDEHPFAGNNYYRLKSVGNNGEHQYSKIVKVNSTVVTPGLHISPNPIAADRIIRFSATGLSTGTYSMEIYNDLGQKVASSKNNFDGTNNTVEWKLESPPPSGNYTLQLSNSEMRINASLLLL